MAACTNCTGGNTATGTYSNYGSSYPSSQFGMNYTYPSTCPGGCLYFTNTGYRCSNNLAGWGTGCGCKGNCRCNRCCGDQQGGNWWNNCWWNHCGWSGRCPR